MLLNNKYNYNPKTDQIGEGGFGRVFKAYDTVLEQEVALKMVDSGKLSENYSLVKEVQKARRLMHENLIQYYDAFFLETETATGEILRTEVAVMEYIPGGSLQEFNWKAQPPEVQKELVKGILNGLGHLHKKGVIHRDIKPSNILIAEEDGHVISKITDFGISKVRGAKSASVSRVVGSFAYMAPEQFEKEKRIDFNTDLWAFGILLYNLFFGELPFGEERTTSEAEIISNIVNQPLPDKVEQIPEPFRDVVKQCLIKDRKKRAQSAAELIAVLEGAEQKSSVPHDNCTSGGATTVLEEQPDTSTEPEQPVSGSKQSEREKEPAPPSKKRILWPWIVGAAAILIVALLFIGNNNNNKPPEKQLADKEKTTELQHAITDEPPEKSAPTEAEKQAAANLKKAIEFEQAGDYQMEQEDYVGAVKSYNEALGLDPDNTQIKNKIAEIKQVQKKANASSSRFTDRRDGKLFEEDNTKENENIAKIQEYALLEINPPPDSAKIIVRMEKTQDDELKITQNSKTRVQGTKYYLACASFAKKKNAEILVENFKAKGINGFIKQSETGFYRVVIGVFDTQEEALKSLHKLRNNPDLIEYGANSFIFHIESN